MTITQINEAYWKIRKDRNLSNEEKRAAWLGLSSIPLLAKDNVGNEYPVFVWKEEPIGTTLWIASTPGSWLLSSLQESQSPAIAIDFGQNWLWVNVEEVLAACINTQ